MHMGGVGVEEGMVKGRVKQDQDGGKWSQSGRRQDIGMKFGRRKRDLILAGSTAPWLNGNANITMQ